MHPQASVRVLRYFEAETAGDVAACLDVQPSGARSRFIKLQGSARRLGLYLDSEMAPTRHCR